MARRLCFRVPLLFTAAKSHIPVSAARLLYFSDAAIFRFVGLYHPMFQVSRSYARDRRPSYDPFGGKVPKAAEFGKEWAKKMEDDEIISGQAAKTTVITKETMVCGEGTGR
ncbi:uncharacterized protein LOC131019597 [Salvia miltiorrhiza]|uniref:uncharacterized protein LOC131019597 n=1 Tax=Salvia miltiorrhiza TaxID=226208 RepID=UPI0025AD0F8F|nr:uncharacterized protein LOC131019597 [Salvia miltiorrhiza]